MKIYISFILFLFTTLSLQAQHAYYPLEKGKTFIYAYTLDFATVPNQKSKTVIADDKKEIDGQDYFQQGLYLGDQLFQTLSVRHDKEGNVYAINIITAKEDLVLPKESELAVGKSWTSSAGDELMVADMNDSFTIEGKTFSNCLVLQTKSKDNEGTKMYLQKGKGMVAISLMMEGEEKIMQYLVE